MEILKWSVFFKHSKKARTEGTGGSVTLRGQFLNSIGFVQSSTTRALVFAYAEGLPEGQ